MKKQLLIIAAMTATGLSAGAQTQALLGLYKQQNGITTTPQGKTNASLFRIVGLPTYRHDGAQFVPDDSTGMTYTGIRGGMITVNTDALIFNQSPYLPFDNSTMYDYNNGTTSWDKMSQTLQTFNTANNPDMSVSQNWNSGTSSWDNTNKSIYGYDANNNPNSIINQSWSGGAWQNTGKDINTFNGSHQITEGVHQTWSGGAWVNANKTMYSYTGANIDTKITQNWNGTSWDNSSKSTYNYSPGATHPDNMVNQTWTSGAWKNNTKSTYTYTGAVATSAIGQSWDDVNSVWKNTAKTDLTANGDGNFTLVVGQNWDAGTSAWVNSSKATYGYNSNNLVSSYDNMNWNIGGFWEYTTNNIKQTVYYEAYTNSVAGVEKAQGSLTVYPNPAVSTLNINMVWDNAQPFTVAVYDMQGRLVKQLTVPAMKNYTNSIDIADMAAGNYILVVKGTSGQTSSMFAVGK
jgi:hypothetical protein